MKKLFTLLCIAFIAINASAGIDPATRARIHAEALASLQLQTAAKHSVKPVLSVNIAEAAPLVQPRKTRRAAADVSFDIRVTDITATTATIGVAPSSDDITYYWNVIDKASYDKAEAGTYAATGINNAIDYVTYCVSYFMKQGYALEDLVSKGADVNTFTDLEPGYDWVAIACLIDDAGVCSEPSATKFFSTPAEEPIGDFSVAFTVSNVSSTSATVDAVPSDNTTAYYYDVFSTEEIETIESGSYAGAGINGIEDYMTFIIKYYVAQYGYSVSDFQVRGNNTYTFNGLNPNTDYVVVGCAITSSGVCQAPGSRAEFSTSQTVASTNKITITHTDGNICISTTNDDQYFMHMEKTADFYEYYSPINAANVAKELDDWIYTYQYYEMQPLTFKGDQTFADNTFWTTYFSEDDLVKGTEYIVMAAPFAGVVNGDAAYMVFIYGATDGIANVNTSITANGKYLDNGTIVIKHNGMKFNVAGQLKK